MRIAQVAPLSVATPPHGYGGTERIISGLTEALVKQGHEVTLFATGDSQTSARLVACAPKALGFEHLFESGAAHTAMLAQVYRKQGLIEKAKMENERYSALTGSKSTPEN